MASNGCGITGARVALMGVVALGALACSGATATPDPDGGRGGSSSAGGAGGSGVTAGSGGSGGSAGGSGGSGGATGSPGTGGTSSAGAGGSQAGGAGGSAGAGGAGGSGSGGGGGAGGVTGAGGGAAGTGGSGTGGAAGSAAIVNLFNGTDLTGFDVYRETQATSPGTLLTGAQAQAIFKPENGVIHVYADAADQSTQARHTLVTKASYGRYNLWWEYKWGTKKFAPYTDLVRYPRDAGVLWHIHGDRSQVWPPSMEFQNKDGTTGDIFVLYARCTSLGRAGGTTFVEAADGGTTVTINSPNGFTGHTRSANFEIPNDWNVMLMQVNGGSAVYTVNGHVVNRVLSVSDKNGAPVTSGPIAWQAEHAEVYYRNLRIQVMQ